MLLGIIAGSSALCIVDAFLTYRMPVYATVLLGVILCWHTWYAYRQVSRRIHIDFRADTWTISNPNDRSCYAGMLARASYRSRWLLVLTFTVEDGTTRTETIWRDAVSASTFSRLHFAAAYGLAPRHVSAEASSPRHGMTAEERHR